MAYLLDTNVLSELRKQKKCDNNVKSWQSTVPVGSCYISVVSIMEIKKGLLLVALKDSTFARDLDDWFEKQIKPSFQKRTIPINSVISEIAANLLAERSQNLADVLIAASAMSHDLTLVTRNVADFQDKKIKILNPWEFTA